MRRRHLYTSGTASQAVKMEGSVNSHRLLFPLAILLCLRGSRESTWHFFLSKSGDTISAEKCRGVHRGEQQRCSQTGIRWS